MPDLRLVPLNQLLDKQFFIPHYQRGYRWADIHVTQLLDDIDAFSPKEILGTQNEKTFYCLQPLVIKELDENIKNKHNLFGEWYEIIDGQQRLTTIYIILQFINQKWKGEEKIKQFNLFFETRSGCVEFLRNLRLENDIINIDKTYSDFYYISRALQTIWHWRKNYDNEKGKPLDTAKFESTFLAYTKIIWYLVSPDANSRALFERLNLGKIPLTNSELIKALFLSSESFKHLAQEDRKIKQYEIASLWDEIEHKLNEPDLKFWSFLTNNSRVSYETKIELILDLISGKQENDIDDYFTFLWFTKEQKKADLSLLWEEIERFYYTVKEWYSNREFYHRIGYLITSKKYGHYKSVELNSLVKDSIELTKVSFSKKIDSLITGSVNFEVSELRYENHYNQIFNVLLLFNVETNRRSSAITEFYPFKQHKDRNWSLEHIHARKSENFDKTKKDQWRKWLDLHKSLMEEISQTVKDNQKKEYDSIIDEIENYNTDTLTWERFSQLFKTINDVFTEDKTTMDRESEGISNLALLSQPDNAALNNSVFEIKKREIVKLDKEGNFIPVCTRRTFMKYYSEDVIDSQHFFWSAIDRNDYYKAILDTIQDYLPKYFTETEDIENE